MLDLNRIRNNPQEVLDLLWRKNPNINFDELLKADKERRELLQETEKMKAERNRVSALVPKLKKEGKPVDETIAAMKKLGTDISEMDKKVAELSSYINTFMAELPNIPDADVVAGGKENNAVVKVVGEKPVFDFEAKNHVDLCNNLKMIDYERGAKVGGNGFWFYRHDGARLEWALLNFFISEHIADGYEFILPPHMLNYNCGFGAGQFPKFAEEVYWIDSEGAKEDGHFLLPTAETVLVNMYRDEIIDANELPMKFAGYTPCYRKEAGSYRSEERGMIRGHQFNKVEMIQYTTPEGSDAAFEEMLGKAARLVEKLGLHFRISKLAAGDCSASMARTYDIEVWIPSMGIYKEVSSVSNAREYQARRNNTRFRNAQGKPEFIHTLNGSGLATSRILPAIVEQYQNADGSITIPEVLRPFMGGQEKITK
ncbi:MAG: serine--tRNA ligase [Clostridia bacterium]|nr:serine--tRNA ligase [Clostridia bacterium]